MYKRWDKFRNNIIYPGDDIKSQDKFQKTYIYIQQMISKDGMDLDNVNIQGMISKGDAMG